MSVLTKILGNLLGILLRKNLLTIKEVIEICEPLEGVECDNFKKLKELAKEKTDPEPNGVIQGRLLKILVNKEIISKNEFLYITAQINESELEEARKETEAEDV